MLMKYHRPTSINKEPFFMIWHANLESGIELWVQGSTDIEHPDWQRLGDVYEKTYLEKYHKQESDENKVS